MNYQPLTATVAALDVTLVQAPACHLCEEAEAALTELARLVPLRIERFDASSQAGRALLLEHRAGMLPLVLINGKSLSSGRLPRGALRKIRSDWTRAAEPRPGEMSWPWETS